MDMRDIVYVLIFFAVMMTLIMYVLIQIVE